MVEQVTGASAGTRAGAAAAAGACAGVLVSGLRSWQLGTLVGWDVAAAVYVAWSWRIVWHEDPADTARLAVREDPARPVADALLLVASVASLLAIALVITAGPSVEAGERDVRAGLAVVSVVLSWTVVHTVYSARYARLYYGGTEEGGIDFNQEGRPRFSDFVYLAFTIGMTFQVSDTELQTSEMRTTALRHALLSYLLGAVILATTINLVSGLLR
jgi:uncharacterized membrane protein